MINKLGNEIVLRYLEAIYSNSRPKEYQENKQSREKVSILICHHRVRKACTSTVYLKALAEALSTEREWKGL